jgi:4'-phosphopantetheinyl transferase
MLIDTYALNLDKTSADLAADWQVLSEDERTRALRFRYASHQYRWIAARAGLRRVLSEYCHTSPSQLEFSKKALGKPVLGNEHSNLGIHFNLSHSGKLAVLAVTRNGPVGIDIEHCKAIPDLESVARRFFSETENKQLLQLGRSSRQAAFYRCWTRKEAVIKTSGKGLSARLHAFDVSLRPDAPPAVLGGSHCGIDAARWQLNDINVDDCYEVSVASYAANVVDVQYHGVYE